MNKDIFIYLKIAEIPIQIIFKKCEWSMAFRLFYSQFLKYYRGFTVSKRPYKSVATITVHEEPQLSFFSKKNDWYIYCFHKHYLHYQTHYQISIFQFQIIIRDILIRLLAKRNGLFIHASANLVGERVVLNVGSSGAGKSTVARLQQKKHPIFADDTLVIRKIKKIWCAFQLPFVEKKTFMHKSNIG
ncbi:hypothetical protein HZA75_02025, partial [Candidatus Roizmanbacteria bacterium]|nr:hypothetical protein [Candidatus Roizmanbacteria bacterium]